MDSFAPTLPAPASAGQLVNPFGVGDVTPRLKTLLSITVSQLMRMVLPGLPRRIKGVTLMGVMVTT